MVSSIAAEFRRYKSLGEGALAQLRDAEFAQSPSADDNSVAVIVWHIAGNLRSRFTDFRTTDGEKPWRDRDEEFVARSVTREELLAKWESGWQALFTSLAELTDGDVGQTVIIRGQEHTIGDALLRSLAHVSYHVGQIVYIAKAARGSDWKTLSIPRGQSGAYNRNPRAETPDRHAAALKERI